MTTERITRTGIFLVAMVAVITAFTFTPESTGEMASSAYHTYATPLIDSSPSSFDDCGFCNQEPCVPGEHKLSYSQENLDRRHGETLHPCEEGWCSQAHAQSEACLDNPTFVGLSDDQKRQLWDAAVDGVTHLTSLMGDYGNAVSYNAGRRALQVQGCDGAIILSIPLTLAQTRQFTE